ncbi:TolC family protein, partial [Bacteriovoracaceae bacterium]|nr:TolC family protein [Bacteriovoracaceae bacterium]
EEALATVDYRKIQEDKILEFLTIYIDAAMDETFYVLANEDLKRALAREQLIRRRVNDGLLEKVDLIDGKINIQSRKRDVKKIMLERNRNSRKLEDILVRTLKKRELPNFDEFEQRWHENFETTSNQSNENIRKLEKSVQLANRKIKLANMDSIPVMNIKAYYGRNGIDSNKSKTYSTALRKGGQRDLRFEFDVTLPLFSSELDDKQEQARIGFLNSNARLSHARMLQRQEETHLEIDLSLLKSQLILSKKKVEYTKKSLLETNNLYLLGKKDMDNIIEREERLINARREVVQTKGQFAKKWIHFLHLQGKLIWTLTDRTIVQ